MSKNTADKETRPARAPREIVMEDDPLANMFGGPSFSGRSAASQASPGSGGSVVSIDRTARPENAHEPAVVSEVPTPLPNGPSERGPRPDVSSPPLAPWSSTSKAPTTSDSNAASSRARGRAEAPAVETPAQQPQVRAPAGPISPDESVDAVAPGAKSISNRIGTRHEPYTRKTDGIQTRQASTTLPMSLLKRLDHCAIDVGKNRSSLIYDAVCEYLDTRGYTEE